LVFVFCELWLFVGLVGDVDEEGMFFGDVFVGFGCWVVV